MESIRNFQKKVSYESHNNELDLESSDQFNNSYEFQEFVSFRSDYFSKQDSLFENVQHEKWKTLSSINNPVSYIMHKENKTKFEIFSKSWVKIYEIIEEFQLIPNSKGQLNTLHLGEETGAMVCAVNHYLRSKCLGVSHMNFKTISKISLFFLSGNMEVASN